ncbi:hypothetical protein ES703_125774 [subsurface metagenome]
MLGDISDEEFNELIVTFSQSVLENFQTRGVVESKIFPVNHYIHVACYILYDQSYQYNILKEVASKISPEDIAKRSKFLGSRSNHLAFYSLLMLYLHGRAEIIHDNLSKKKAGETNIVVEPETKKKETKFILDFWKRLSPNYLNDETLILKNKKNACLSDDYIEKLKDNMIPINNNKEITKRLKQTIAHLTIYSFLSRAECRMSISEHGPYYFEDNTEPLIFKEFLELHTGDVMFEIDMTGNMPYKITTIAPFSNVIFGMTLKDMNKIEFNDWNTLFADPTDFSSNITSIGIWTRELSHPKDLRYPDNLGELKPLSLNILEELSKFAKSATKELYTDISKWNFTKKLLFGSHVYVNSLLSVCAQYAGIEDNFNWTWPFDYASGKPLKTDLIDKEKIKFYIDKLGKKIKTGQDEKEAGKLHTALEKYEGVHLFITREGF